jgi:hypothetical protein
MVRVLDFLEDYLRSRVIKYERIDGSVRGNDRQAAIDRYEGTRRLNIRSEIARVAYLFDIFFPFFSFLFFLSFFHSLHLVLLILYSYSCIFELSCSQF